MCVSEIKFVNMRRDEEIVPIMECEISSEKITNSLIVFCE